MVKYDSLYPSYIKIINQTYHIFYFILDIRVKYQNPNINDTYPKINDHIELPSENLRFIIYYNIPIIPSTGNLIIYQYDENNDMVLKQLISGQDQNHCKINNNTISIKVLSSIFHKVNATFGTFGIKVNKNFVKFQITQEPLLGISEGIWNFTACKLFFYY